MPDRGLNSTLLAEYAKQGITIGHLFSFGWDTGTDYLADGRRDIPWNSQTWRATGELLKVPAIKESLAPALDSINISVSGVNQANIYTALTEDYTNVEVEIYRFLMDSDMKMIGEAHEIFAGLIDTFSVNENPDDGTSEITWKVTSHWHDFERVAGRRTNDSSQQYWFPGDTGLRFASRNISNLKWGVK